MGVDNSVVRALTFDVEGGISLPEIWPQRIYRVLSFPMVYRTSISRCSRFGKIAYGNKHVCINREVHHCLCESVILHRLRNLLHTCQSDICANNFAAGSC